jgi:hypothetical protein
MPSIGREDEVNEGAILGIAFHSMSRDGFDCMQESECYRRVQAGML